jgi:hemerythrin-like domain-containing protein
MTAFDRREMLMVHTALRREFALLPRAVRATRAADEASGSLVSGHITCLLAMLQHHHESEDAHLWPLLRDRCADSLASFDLMEVQHDQLAAEITAVRDDLERWQADLTLDRRDALVDRLIRVAALLSEHLTAEEHQILPLMERHLTAAEWDAMVQAGAASADPANIVLHFGMLMYEGDPETVEHALAGLPAELRPLIAEEAVAAFAEHALLVHGTATPLRSFDAALRIIGA